MEKSKVNIDYHIEVDRHYYSVPFQLARTPVDVRLTSCVVEVLHKGQRVASHSRSPLAGRHTTSTAHMPKSHQKHLEWTPQRLLNWGERIGPATSAIIRQLLEDKPHPEMGYRSCLGVFRGAWPDAMVKTDWRLPVRGHSPLAHRDVNQYNPFWKQD